SASCSALRAGPLGPAHSTILYAAPAMSLQHSSALVTGGASGMGDATSRRLAAEGAHVVVVDRDGGKGEAVAADIKGLFCEADITDEATTRAAAAAAVELAPPRTCSTARAWVAPSARSI